MTTEDIMQLDCREERNRNIIQKALKKIKPLSRYDGVVPIEKLELCIKKYCDKYKYYYRLYPDTDAADDCIVWKGVILDSSNLKQIGVAYGRTLYEVISKSVIKLYSITRKTEV